VPIEIAVLNASYINSIREKSSIHVREKNVSVQIIEDRTETGRQEVEEEILEQEPEKKTQVSLYK
jgi:hypothetical protein